MDAKGDAKRIAMALFMPVLILHAPTDAEAKSLECQTLIGICHATCEFNRKLALCLYKCIPSRCWNRTPTEALSSCDLRCKTSVCFKRYSDAKKIEDCLDSCYSDCVKSSIKS